jgi:uncharacterized membrane protein HdeD (DUF308 family)
MEEAQSRSRGSLVVRGILALALGLIAMSWPHLTLAILILAFATYAIGDGLFAIASVLSGAREERATAVFIEGLLSVAAGLFVLFAPATASKVAFICIGLWAVATGVMQLIESPRVYRESGSEALMVLSGVLRIVLGMLLLARPQAGLMGLVWLLAVYAFIEGFVMLGLAFRGKRGGPVVAHPA